MEDINFEFFYPRHAKRITLRIKPNRTVRVTAPKWLKRSDLTEFLMSHPDWVMDKIEELERHTTANKFKFIDGSQINFLNQNY